ncbi:MAG: acyl-CoA desaturase [Moorea sp. SIO4A3]|nr:acyl-CoA desaturase [Moorena sp. SIO4A3]
MLNQLDSKPQLEPVMGSGKRQKITIKSDRLKIPLLVHALAIALIPLLGSIVAIVMAFKLGVGLVEVGLLVTMYTLTMLGITVGFHRHFSHCSFQAGTAVRVILAILGSMAAQGPLIYWVSNHRRHHQYSDLPGDIHSPYFKQDERLSGLRGLWYSHMGWTFSHGITNTALFAKDLLREPTISKINQLYYLWVLLGLAIPTLLGGLLTGTWMGLISGFLWGGCVRLFLIYHVTNSINSITHLYGSRPFDTREQSTNNIWLAIPTGGEAWHNNHHAFPNSAIFGLKWWQIDLGAWGIRFLEKVGLVSQVKMPKVEMINAKIKASN